MKKLAIISEFNPFHNGHKYLVNRGLELTCADLAISLMSGDFVQRGEPASMDKFLRSEAAIRSGFDLVIELPNFISLQAAEFFAKKSVCILDKLKVDYLVFGIENISEDIFLESYRMVKENNKKFENLTKAYVSKNLSYTSARYKALADILKDDKFLTSNNILAIEYLRALDDISTNIRPIPIKRVGAKNQDISINNEKFASSTAIRKSQKKLVRDLMPDFSYNLYKEFYNSFGRVSMDYFFAIFKYKLLIEKIDPRYIITYEEGLDNFIEKSLIDNPSFDIFLKRAATKRYSQARLRRFILNTILDNKIILNDIDINFIKILAFNKKASSYFKEFKDDIHIINRKSDSKILDMENKLIYEKMVNSSNLYNLALGRPINQDFTRKIRVLDT